MKSILIRPIFAAIFALVSSIGFTEVVLAQANSVSCKASNREFTTAQRNADRLTGNIEKTKQDLVKLEENRKRSIENLDKRVQNIATQAGRNTANCYIRTGIADLFGKGKAKYQQCLDRAKRQAEAAAERAARAKLAVESQKANVNRTADSKKAILTQKLTRLEGELVTQKAAAASAKAQYDACVAGGGRP